MKKIIPIMLIGIAMFVSCKKNRTCTCIYFSGSDPDTYDIIDEKLNSAKNICSAKNTPSRDCTID